MVKLKGCLQLGSGSQERLVVQEQVKEQAAV